MKLSTKLYGIVGALALTGVSVGVVGGWCLQSLGDELNTATGKTAMKLDLINATRARVWEAIASNRGMFVAATQQDQPAIVALVRQWEAAYRRIGEQVKEVRPLLVSDRTRNDLDRFEAAWLDFGKVSSEYSLLCRENKLPQITAMLPKLQEFATVADANLTDLKDAQRALLKESHLRGDRLQARSQFLNVLASGLLLAIAVMAVFVVRSINRVLLTAVRQFSEGASQVAAAAAQVASSGQSLAQSSTEHAASLEETSASSEEINSVARKNSENSDQAASLVAKSEERFASANHSLEEMVVAMAEINTQSDRISKIIKVIDEIAFQTNILALNAAVEAARAGESGMGFAVVADEVRNLAQRSARAAKDTATLIEESIAKSNAGKTKVDEVAAAIRTITAESARVKVLVQEVNLGSREQSTGIEQIGKAISQMEQMTQTTAASAEESAAAAQELNAQSEALNASVGTLSTMLGGKGTLTRSAFARRPVANQQPGNSTQFRDRAAAAEDEFPMG